MSMRVYELAKKLGIENKALLPELKKMGVADVIPPGTLFTWMAVPMKAFT